MSYNVNEKPLVSIFLPYYNDEGFLADAIKSILNQTYKNIELILFNHACTDSSRDIARSFDDSRIIHIDSEKNLGAGSGYNITLALPYMKGKYFKSFCADDFMEPDCIENLVDYMENNPKIDFAFGDVEYVDGNLISLKKTFFKTRNHFSVDNDEKKCLRLLRNLDSFLPWAGHIIKMDAIRNVELDKVLIMTFDVYLWITLMVRGYKIGYLDKIVCKYRIHEDQMSSIEKKQHIDFMCIVEKYLLYPGPFLNIKDAELIKYIFYDSDYLDKMETDLDKQFVILEWFTKNEHSATATKILGDWINNDEEKRKYIEEKFGYGISEFREVIKFKPKCKNFKQKIYIKYTKDLNIKDLLFLLVRKAYYLLLKIFGLDKKGPFSA